MKLNDLHAMTAPLKSTDAMPLLFVGHGSPMNAIEQNEFSKGWGEMGRKLPPPQAILCVSAHWETNGTFVTAMEKPRTIHDFGGFPDELYAVQYPAPGSPKLAQHTQEIVKMAAVELDQKWGLDHGCWSVLKHLYPEANVPVLQLSIDRTKPAQWHYELAQDLAALRKKGVQILGSGNMVHNLRLIDWRHPDNTYDWAAEMNEGMKRRIARNEHRDLIQYESLGKGATLAIPTPEHYLPLLYILGLKGKNEDVQFFNDKTLMGSISMTSLRVG